MDLSIKTQLNQYLLLAPFFALSNNRSKIDNDRFLDVYSSLPISLKNILVSEETIRFILLLSDKFQIPTSKLEGLSRIIREAIMANMYIADMPSAIADYLRVMPPTAKEITNLIVSELFAPALEDIKKIQREKFGGEVPSRTQETKQADPINKNNVIDLRNRNNPDQ
jgi:hypothetical protein